MVALHFGCFMSGMQDVYNSEEFKDRCVLLFPIFPTDFSILESFSRKSIVGSGFMRGSYKILH